MRRVGLRRVASGRGSEPDPGTALGLRDLNLEEAEAIPNKRRRSFTPTLCRDTSSGTLDVLDERTSDRMGDGRWLLNTVEPSGGQPRKLAAPRRRMGMMKLPARQPLSKLEYCFIVSSRLPHSWSYSSLFPDPPPHPKLCSSPRTRSNLSPSPAPFSSPPTTSIGRLRGGGR